MQGAEPQDGEGAYSVAAPQRGQAAPRQSPNKLCLCPRLALPFVTELDKARNEADTARLELKNAILASRCEASKRKTARECTLVHDRAG